MFSASISEPPAYQVIVLVAVGFGDAGDVSTRVFLVSSLNAMALVPEMFSFPTSLATDDLVMVLPSLNLAVSTTLSL